MFSQLKKIMFAHLLKQICSEIISTYIFVNVNSFTVHYNRSKSLLLTF